MTFFYSRNIYKYLLIVALVLFLYTYVWLDRVYNIQYTGFVTNDLEINNDDGDHGYILLINDMHANPMYREYGVKLHWDSCNHEDLTMNNTIDLKHFGTYTCDPPVRVCFSVLDFMKKVIKKPNFIIWMGDSIAHYVPRIKVDNDFVFSVISNFSQYIHNLYPDTPIFPLFGNHDQIPHAQLDSKPYSDYYKNLLYKAKWNLFLKDNARKQFLKNGDYSVIIDENTTLIVLNTLVYFIKNKQVDEDSEEDPLAQFEWFENQLLELRSRNHQALVVIHFPPGSNENQYTHRKEYEAYFKKKYNKKYLNLVAKYGDVIVAQFISHTHLDTFRLFENQQGPHRVPGFIAPAITSSNRANQPGFRVYKYSKPTKTKPFLLIDYFQYYFNLEEANLNGYIKWKLRYKFRDEYKLPDLSGESMEKLFSQIKKHDSVYNKFFDNLNMGLKKNFTHCKPNCKKYILCTMECSDPDQYFKCIAKK